VTSSGTQERIAERYLVFECLGQGGMGSVYRVRDERTGRECALKQLSLKAGADPMVAELFEREFHTLAELAHPSIIEVYDYGIDGGRAYYTMELLAGQDLRSLGKLPWRNACEYLRDVASSLAILHSRRLLHCDVSPRNVQCTASGQAKLLDFGAMAPMGVAKRIVGTPPFIAPEMLNLQTLDGRTDLYAFGALAYLTLTGQLAYPARDVGQLRDLWRRPVPPPSQLVPEIPAALSELVIELIQISRNARPRSAGLVMERLCSIAGLPFEEAGEVASAYLATPSLVGRESQLAQARERLVSTLKGQGGLLLVAAASGGGRSRFLDACVLEAKLLGLQVIRIDKTDAERGTYGAASALCRQLFELAPQAARNAAQLHAAVLAHVVGAELAGAQPNPVPPERAQILAALRDFGLSCARSLRLFVAVDDAESIDEATAGMLVAFGQKASKRPLCLALTVNSDAEGSAALDILTSLATRIELPPLSEAETELLLGAIFGDAKHLLSVARRIHAIARGNLRATMQLATHLVTEGIARYAAGSFSLPEQLREQDLPSSLAAALASRIRGLDPDSIELARMLALTDPSELSATAYVELTSHGDRARTYRAIDHLVRVQVLERQAERYRLSDPTWAGVLTSGLRVEERLAAHARLAQVFEHTGTLTRRSFHLMESDQAEAAIRLMLAQFIKDPNEPKDPLADYVPGLIDQIERASIAAESLHLPAPLRVELKMKLCGASQFLGDVPRFLRNAPATLAELERDSGLADYNSLDPGLDSMARLTEALTRTQARYDATAADKRTLSPIEAIRELARCCAMFAGVGAISGDITVIDRIPTLAPFVPLSPAVGAIQQFIEFTRLLVQAREDEVREGLPAYVARLEQPDGAGLGHLYNKSLRLGSLYMLGLIEATEGIANAGDRVAAFESEAGYRLNAQRVHMACALMQGNIEAALSAQRSAEMVMLQDGQQQRYPGTTMRPEMLAFWLSEDVAGLKQLSERLGGMVANFPNWDPVLRVARALVRVLQGDAAGALPEIERALEVAKPLRSRDWASVAAAHVVVLSAVGRAEEALAIGRSYMQICAEKKIAGYRRIGQSTAEALLALKRGEEAAALADSLIEQALARGVRGLALGALYEVRARAATAVGDEDAFFDYCQRCAAEYQPDRNPAVAARYQRLVRDALGRRAVADTGALRLDLPPNADAGITTIYSRLLECDDSESRAQCVLTILAENTNAKEAYFYALRGGKAELVCALPERSAPDGLQTRVEEWLEAELETSEPHRSLPPSRGSLRTPANDLGTSVVSLRGDAAALHSILLYSKSSGQRTIVGVAALNLGLGAPKLPEAWLVEALATALLEHDDVDPATCII
jgi:hypothetical protein